MDVFVTVEIVPTTRAYLRELVANMRADDRDEIVALGGHVRHTVYRLLEESQWSRTALVDGIVAACWGLEGEILSYMAHPWLFTTGAVERVKMTFLRTLRGELRAMMETKRTLVTRVSASYAKAIRLFEHVGFEIGPVQDGVWRLMVLERDAPQLPKEFTVAVPQPVSTDIVIYGGVFARMHVIPQAGSYVPQHSHGYDHPSILMRGALRAWCDGALIGDFRAGIDLAIKIAAGTEHTFMALEDDTAFLCVHSIDRFEENEGHELPGVVLPGLVKNRLGDLAGVTIKEERLIDVWEESRVIRGEHAAEVGERPGMALDINWAALRRMDRMGVLVSIVMRSNGRIFGYVGAILGPSLENSAALMATQTSFFVSQEYRGAGMKLQRALIDAVRERGVHRLQGRVGVRGSGPKMGALWLRVGAKPVGEMYELEIRAA